MASMLARLLGNDVVLAFALQGDLGRVVADPAQIEQVLLNLALNARDAMPGGGTVSIGTANLEIGDLEPAPGEALRDLVPGSYVTLTVRDTGVGMDSQLTQQIFEPFYTTKGVGEGTGLGLATVHGIVSQSGGSVWVDSEQGNGTCFTICLPRVASPVAQLL